MKNSSSAFHKQPTVALALFGTNSTDNKELSSTFFDDHKDKVGSEIEASSKTFGQLTVFLNSNIVTANSSIREGTGNDETSMTSDFLGLGIPLAGLLGILGYVFIDAGIDCRSVEFVSLCVRL